MNIYDNISKDIIDKRIIKKTITENSFWTNVVPVGYMIEIMIFEETAGNAAILDLGTTDGGNDVFTGQVISANDITTIVINKTFSMSVSTDLDLNDDQIGSSWNNANVDITLVLRRITQ